MRKKDAVIFIVGVALGAIPTWFFTKKHYDDISKKEIEEVKQYYKAKAFDEIEIVEEVEEDPSSKEEDDILAPRIKTNTPNFQPSEYVNYSNIASDYAPDGSDIQSSLQSLREAQHPLDDGEYPKPYIVSETDYGSDPKYFDSSTLIYYYEDHSLVDEETNELFDDIGMVGEENVEAFIDDSETEVMYIRNERISMEYMLVKDYGSWE